jgi:hypothetical protein
MMNTRMPFHSRAGQAHGLHGLHVMAGGAFLLLDSVLHSSVTHSSQLEDYCNADVLAHTSVTICFQSLSSIAD